MAPRRPGRWRVIALLALLAGALLVAISEIATREAGEEDPVALEGVREAQRIYGGVRQYLDRLGDPGAPVTVQLYTDMHCVPCAEHFLATVPQLVDGQVRTGRAQLRYRHYSFSRNAIQEGFIAAEAAAEQGYLWQYAHIFFASQGEAERLGVDADFLAAVAVSIPELELAEWERDYRSGREEGSELRDALRQQDETARSQGLRAEPSAVVSGPEGTETLQDSPPLEEILAAAERVG